MLTESVSDPRRANWLTITSMCEDLCWPDEPHVSRPNWELEAEILRLTTRLMMRERELRQAKNQLKAQASRTQQQASAWRQRMEEKEEQMKELLLQKDAEMQNIVSQLLLFEAELRREQSRIEDLLGEKDAQIQSQKMEIDRLKSSDSKNSTIYKDSHVSASGLRREQSRIEDLLDARMQCKEMDIDLLTNADAKVSDNPEDSDVPAAEFRLEQSRIDGFLDPRIQSKRMEIDRLKNYNTKTAEDSVVVSAAELMREHSRIEELLDVQIYQYRKKETKRLKNSDSKTSNSSEDSGVVMSSSDSCPSPSEMKDEFEKSDSLFQIHQDGVFEDSPTAYDSQLAVQKLKDGLVKIRAIQDVTNVKSLDFSYDCVVTDKKRLPYRAPQKMKDLKAKRNINPHKIHRPFVSGINNQVIL